MILRETVGQIKSKEMKFKNESLDWDETLWHLSAMRLYAAAAAAAAAAAGTWKPPPLQEIQLFLRGPRFQSGRTNVWAQEGSHRLGGARSSHTHRICKDFNNEPLTPNHRDRSGVNKALYICKCGRGAGAPIKAEPGPGSRHHTHSLWHLLDLQVSEQRCQTWWNTFQWTGWPRAITTRRRLGSAELARIPHRPADLTFPAWCSRARRLLARVTCSPNPKLQSLPSARRSADSRTPACAHLCIQQAVSSLKTNLALKQWIQLFFYARAVCLNQLSLLSPVSETSGYSSGYESEAASSECLSVDEGSELESGPQRRVRTKFSPEQISRLEKIFNKHKYLDAGERVKTAQKLSLTETQVGADSQCKDIACFNSIRWISLRSASLLC